MSGFQSGSKYYLTDSIDHVLDLKNGLKYLDPVGMIRFLQMIGTNKFTAKSVKHEWTETVLAGRGETVTIAGAGTNPITVANAYIYQVNEVIRCEDELIRITAIASATTLTVTRGYAGTTAAAHTAKMLYSLGAADPENSAAPAGITDSGDRLYNYVQTFTRGVELSNNEILQLSTEENPLNGQLERRFKEINYQLARAIFYGIRYEDTGNRIHTMGGLKQFVNTNVSNVAGALGISSIDAQLLNIVLAGGDPKVMVMHPYQKQKLDALDANKQLLGKKEHTGGNLVTNTWQSGILDHEIEVITDQSVLTDQLWILDTDNIAVGPASNNGVNGAFHVEDATTPGTDGKKKVIRGKYTMEVGLEKAHALLYGLS